MLTLWKYLTCCYWHGRYSAGMGWKQCQKCGTIHDAD